jgi:hypothetical protein
MFVKLEALIFELILRRRINFGGFRPRRQKPHHRVAVMPGRRVLYELAGHIADRAEHQSPGQQLGVADFVELLGGQIEQRAGVPPLQFGDHPFVELEFGVRILPRAWVV